MTDDHKTRRSGRNADVLLITGFLAILAYPAIALLQSPETLATGGLIENRVLSPRPPAWRLTESPSEFVTEFKAFFEDQFTGRGKLVSLNSTLRRDLFEVSARPKVIVGKHQSLFYAGDPIVPPHDFGHEAAKARNVLPASESRIRRIREFLESRRKWAEAQGAKFLFVLAPDKSTVYREFLPDWLSSVEGPSFTDRVLQDLRAHSSIDLIDLRTPMETAKESGKPLYYLHDTHWNDEGALIGYNETTKRLKETYEAIRPLGPDDVVRKRKMRRGDLAYMLHLDEGILEPTVKVSVKAPRSKEIPFPLDPTPVPGSGGRPTAFVVDDPKLPKALIYHDSYMTNLRPFLAENFQSSIYIWDPRITTSQVKGYKPDVVIFESVERTLFLLASIVDELMPLPDPAVLAEQSTLVGGSTRR